MNYREKITEMLKQIKDGSSIKMIYGFVKALRDKDSEKNRKG